MPCNRTFQTWWASEPCTHPDDLVRPASLQAIIFMCQSDNPCWCSSSHMSRGKACDNDLAMLPRKQFRHKRAQTLEGRNISRPYMLSANDARAPQNIFWTSCPILRRCSLVRMLHVINDSMLAIVFKGSQAAILWTAEQHSS